MIRNFRRFVAPLMAIGLAACHFGEAGAAGNVNRQDFVAMGNKGPFGGRDDGIGFDRDNYGAGLVSNGEIGPMFNSAQYVTVDEDFLGFTLIADSGDTFVNASAPWVSEDTATAGCPARKADYDNGALELLLDNGNEVGDCDLYWGDERNIDSDTEPFCYFRIQYQTAPAAADTLSWGLFADRNDLLSGFDTFVGFSVAGADNNLDFQSDDGTTDVNATDTTVDMTAGTFIETIISMNNMHNGTADKGDYCSATNVCGFYRTSTGGVWTRVLPNTTFSVGADLAMQPYVHIEKTSGTSTPDLLVDRIWCSWQRE